MSLAYEHKLVAVFASSNVLSHTQHTHTHTSYHIHSLYIWICTPGFNFTNILRTPFTHPDPKIDRKNLFIVNNSLYWFICYYPFHFLGNIEFLCIIDFDLWVILLYHCSLLRILLLSDNNFILKFCFKIIPEYLNRPFYFENICVLKLKLCLN